MTLRCITESKGNETALSEMMVTPLQLVSPESLAIDEGWSVKHGRQSKRNDLGKDVGIDPRRIEMRNVPNSTQAEAVFLPEGLGALAVGSDLQVWSLQ